MSEKNKPENAQGSPVVFIETPFGNPIVDVSEAQGSEDELVLDEDGADAADEELPADLEAAAAEWSVDEDSAADAADAPIEARDADPTLGLTSPEEAEADLQRLARTMAVHQAEYVAELEKVVGEEQAEAAARLAREIAEDQALAQRMKEEEEKPELVDPELAAAMPARDENGNLDLQELQSCIETLLFMTDKPMSQTRLHELLGPDAPLSIFQEAMTELKNRYQHVAHGFELVEIAGGYQFRTKPGRAALAKKLAKVQTQRLSSGAMESLAIVAYRQPVLKDEIDKIRGVDSSHFIRTLMDRKLIQITGRSELPGRPMLYATTPEFLALFGLKDLSAMPSLRELEQMVPTSQSKNPEDEDPRVKEMRKLVDQMKMDTSTQLIYDPKEDEKILKSIRERVNSIPTSTPYLEAQKEAERQAKLQAEGGPQLGETGPAQGDLLSAVPANGGAAEGGPAVSPAESADLPPPAAEPTGMDASDPQG